MNLTSSSEMEPDSLARDAELGAELLPPIVNALQSPVFVKDERFRFVFLNDAFCKLMGRPRVELIGRTDFDVAPPKRPRFSEPSTSGCWPLVIRRRTRKL